MEIFRLKMLFAAIAALLTAAWLASIDPALLFQGFWPLRGLLIPFTGILAIGFMSIAVVLAARPVQVESALGGLDKYYLLHKWLSVGGVLMAVAHWLLEIVPRSMARNGWLERPQRPPAPSAADPGLLDSLRGPAVEVGEWGLYLLLVLVVLALWKRFPYHLFFKTHRLMAPLFLVLIFHGAVLMPKAYWTAPVGLLTALLMAAAAVAAALSLFGRIGKSRRAAGQVTEFHLYSGNAVLDVGVRLETAWPGHDAGQFAYLDFDDAEGAHPFTISSAWRGDGRLVFSIKGIGDYTRRLPEIVHVGQAVTVEGPYGRFDFRGADRRQIWIAGGVGITPFVARLQAIAGAARTQPVDLVYSTAAPDDGFIAQVAEAAAAAGVAFHLLGSRTEGFLTLDRLATWIPEWRDADVWFCGPRGFGKSLRDAMIAAGLPAGRFHQELFELR